LVRAILHQGREDVVRGKGVEVMKGDVTVEGSLAKPFEGVDAVVHLVAVLREQRPWITYQRINVQGTANVVAAAAKAGVKHIVHVSALAAQNNPKYPYLQSKWESEQAVKAGGVPWTVFRPSIMFGPGDEFLTTLAGLVKALPVVPMPGSGDAAFSPIHVEDTSRCIAIAVREEKRRGKEYEIGGPDVLTYADMIDILKRKLGARRVKAGIPMPIMRPQVKLMEALLKRPPATSQQLQMLNVDNTADPKSVVKHFGFEPRRLEDNLDYLRDITYGEAVRIVLGRIPRRLRDH
jgi:NADH dehydrogenase